MEAKVVLLINPEKRGEFDAWLFSTIAPEGSFARKEPQRTGAQRMNEFSEIPPHLAADGFQDITFYLPPLCALDHVQVG